MRCSIRCVLKTLALLTTPDIVKKMGYRVITQEGRGYGMAVSTGLKHVSGAYVTFVDADGSYDPKSLFQMQEELEQKNKDVVFCSRYLPESGSEDDTIIRFIGNKFFTWTLRLLHGVKITDSLFLYVLARRELFDQIQMHSKCFEWCIEFPIKIHQAGFKYSEIPSRERKRIAGDSKVNAFWDGLLILWAMVKMKFNATTGKVPVKLGVKG